jgi:hypothetical protein
MERQTTLALIKDLARLYPQLGIQELFGGIRVDYGKKWVWIDEMRAEEAIGQVHAFARSCGLTPEQRQGPPTTHPYPRQK